jgi:urease accessory protein UreE
MLSGFGAVLRKIDAPFQPEGGAYSDYNHHHSHDEP